MGTRLLEGRDFTDADDEGSQAVAIVNRSLAARFWPGGSALGRRLRLGANAGFPVVEPDQRRTSTFEIVGVVEDGKYGGFSDDGAYAVFRPLRQAYAGSTSIVARTGGDVGAAITAVRGAVREIDPNMPIGAARSFDERLALPLLPARVTALALAGFGALALVLAAIGLYGVMSYSVSSRTKEIGVRMTLGAQPGDVLRLIFGQGSRLVGVGVFFGVVLAVLVTRLMRALLFGISPTDPLTYLAVVIGLSAVALFACWIPARRALKTDPVEALRVS
jgi:putative ABC transport system permease protein